MNGSDVVASSGMLADTIQVLVSTLAPFFSGLMKFVSAVTWHRKMYWPETVNVASY